MNEPTVWSRSARLFHWLIAALILVQGAVGLIMGELPKSPDVIPVYTFHKSLGLTILLLAVFRLGFRLLHKRPDPLPMPGWQHGLSRITHVALYLLLFAVPLSGWIMDSASGLRPLYWWWVLRLPSITGGPSHDLKEFAEESHEILFWVLVAVAALHIAGALKHHFMDRDDTLRRMLPGARERVSNDSQEDQA
ncbi:MAG: cytochrome b [Rhodanobacteraceae bacterium]